MKKVVLLFTILCAGALNSMDPTSLYELRRTGPEQGRYIGTGMEDIPIEVQSLIITHINTGNTVTNAIRDIIRTSRTNTTLNKIVNDMYGNQKGFSELVHVLADKFNLTPPDVAAKFKTDASTTYIQLATALLYSIKSHDTQFVDNIIKQGADVNYYSGGSDKITPLVYAIRYGTADIVKLLLNSKANPNFTGPYTESYAMKVLERNDITEKEAKKQLIENAMNK